MQITSAYPVLPTNDVARMAGFFVDHFHFEPQFSSPWYVHLQSRDHPSVNLAVLDQSHDTIPPAGRGRSASVILNFEVVDVDAEHARLVAAGLPVVLSLRDEAFGQRHFIVAGPDAILVDIITPIPATPEFAALYENPPQ